MTTQNRPKHATVRWRDIPVCYIQGEVPFVTETDNDMRCMVAAEALATYARNAGEDQPGEEVQGIVSGLLASLMHFCDRYGVTDSDHPFTQLILMAEIHYESEKSSDGDS